MVDKLFVDIWDSRSFVYWDTSMVDINTNMIRLVATFIPILLPCIQ